MALGVLRHILGPGPFHSRQQRIFGIGLGRRSEMLGDTGLHRVKGLALGDFRQLPCQLRRVLVGVGLVVWTGWLWLDPVIAILVGLNIIVTGWRLIAESSRGLMDESLPKETNERLREILAEHTSDGVEFHAMRTRVSGARAFMEMHMLVPGAWTVKEGHDAMEDLIDEIRDEFPDLHVTGHLEPIEDPRSYEDEHLDR